MVQNKLPLINSAHGSETRNIINELIKLFNGMGYTYNESLQKAHDILDEAQQTNDTNVNVQQQINTLITESGTSDAEVLQARVDTEGNEYATVKERLDAKEQLIEDINPVFAARYGVHHLNSAAENTDNLRRALADAEAQQKPLFLPSCPSNSYIDINDKIESDTTVHIRGYGRNTRIRQIVFPKPLFILRGDHSSAKSFDVYGVEYDAKGMSDTHGSNTGVRIVGDFCEVDDIYGDYLSTVTRSEDDTGGNRMIESPVFTNIGSGKNIVFNTLIKHTNNAKYDNIYGSYSDLADTPPHLIYVDHTWGNNYNLQGGQCFAKDGTGSFAFQFKGCVGGNAGILFADNCEGVYHVMDSEDFGCREIYSKRDKWTSQNMGSISLQTTANTGRRNSNLWIDKAYVEVKDARGFYCWNADDSHFDNITILGTLDDYGTYYTQATIKHSNNVKMNNPLIINDGSIKKESAILVDYSSNVTVNNPETRGDISSVFFDENNTGVNKLINYDLSKQGSPAQIRSETIVTQDNAVDMRPRRTLIGYSDALAYWDASQVRYVDSGQKFEYITGRFKADVENGYIYSDTQVLAGNIGVIDTQTTNIKLTGKVSYKNEDALVFRVIDKDNLLEFNFYGNNVLLRVKDAGSYTHLEQIPFPGGAVIGRIYEMKVVIHEDRVQCYINGEKLIDTDLSTTLASKFANATKFGIKGTNRGGEWSEIRWHRID